MWGNVRESNMRLQYCMGYTSRSFLPIFCRKIPTNLVGRSMS